MEITIARDFVRALGTTLKRQGVNPALVLEQCGLDPELESLPGARFTHDEGLSMLVAGARITRDPHFGLHVAEEMRATTYEVVTHLTQVGLSARELLSFLSDIIEPVATRHVVWLEENDTRARWCCRYTDDYSSPTPHEMEFVMLSFALGFRRAMPEGTAHFTAVLFRHEAPPDVSEHERLFGISPAFGQPLNAIEIDSRSLEGPVSPPTEELRSALYGHVDALTLRTEDASEVSRRVRELLGADLAQKGPLSKGDVASALGMSERTLQRRLTREGWTFSDLLDDLRCRIAFELVPRTDLTVARIALDLGYESEAGFRKAFLRWTGRSPKEFRREPSRRDVPAT